LKSLTTYVNQTVLITGEFIGKKVKVYTIYPVKYEARHVDVKSIVPSKKPPQNTMIVSIYKEPSSGRYIATGPYENSAGYKVSKDSEFKISKLVTPGSTNCSDGACELVAPKWIKILCVVTKEVVFDADGGYLYGELRVIKVLYYNDDPYKDIKAQKQGAISVDKGLDSPFD